ncbi:GxxExxY protein [Patescibacteria group bacterium AH-259-L07]|nr:GxxExxY protein [Patescibacteria group bacterium AH-259-L07]
MTLSIIIPAYNEKDTIVQSVQSVLRVNFPYPYEVIIVDDGSTDGTREILKTLINADKDADQRGLLFEELTYKIRGCVFRVYNKLGSGHKENVYQKALEEELNNSGLNFEKEKSIEVFYRDRNVGIYRPDFIIDGKVILELKVLPFMGKNEKRQIWTYLKGSKYKLALLVNFGSSNLQIKRIVYDTARKGNIRVNPRSNQRKSAIRIIYKKKNEGKGAALRRGFEKATGDIIAIHDADLEYDPQDLPQLIQPILKGQKIIRVNPRTNPRKSAPVKVVYGSRFLGDYNPEKHKLHYAGNELIAFFISFAISHYHY